MSSSVDAADAAAHLIAAVRHLSHATSLETIVGITTRAARQLVGADGTSFVLRDGDTCHYLDEDAIAPLWKGRHFPLASCISGWAMEHGEQVVIPDIYADSRIPQDAYRPTFVRSLVMTPIPAPDRWAAIGAYWAERREPSAEHADRLEALADSAAVAMENIRVRTLLASAAIERGEHPPGVDPETVTVCAWTRRILHHGSWITIEEFLSRRFGMNVTHGISDDATRAFGASVDDRPGEE